MKDIKVEWTGKYPCLCFGEWILTIDGVDYSNLISFQVQEAGTWGIYEKFHFTEDWDVEWSSYEDGLECEDWIKFNKEWLSKLPLEPDEYEFVYDEFNSSDWRSGSCGGCI